MPKNKKKEIKINKDIQQENDFIIRFLNVISKGLAPYIIISSIIFVVYFHTLSYDLTGFDDDIILRNSNSMVFKNNPLEAFKADALLSFSGVEFYRPVQGLSFIVDSIAGNNSLLYFHLSNLFIHIINCCFLFYLLTLFNKNKILSLALTLVYSIHPLFNLAIIWLPSRGDLLVTLFSIISFICYLKFLISKKYLYLLINIITFFLAVFSKEIAILLPAIFLVYSYIKEKNLRKIFKSDTIILAASWLIIIISYIIARGSITKISLSGDKFGIIPLIHNLPVIPEFISKFFIPFNLSVLPEFNILVSLTGLILIGLITFIYFKHKNIFSDYTFLFFGWFIIFLFVTLLYRHEHLSNAYDYLEHRAYLPVTGIILLISSLKLNQNKMKILIYSSFIIFFIFSGITLSRTYIFKTADSFYTSVIEKGTTVALAYNNRGLYFDDKGRKNEAKLDFDKAIELKPDYAEAYNNRGYLKNDDGDLAGALSDCNRAIDLKPNYAVAYNNRGNIRKNSADFNGALLDYNKAIESKADFALAYNNRGNIKKIIGDKNGAISDYNLALEIDPNYAEPYMNRGCVKLENGNI